MDIFRRIYRGFMMALFAGPYVAIIDQGIASASNFVPIVLLARFSTASELGIYSLFFTVWVFASGFEHALITAPYTFYCDHSARDAAKYRGSILVHHIGFVAALSAVLLLVGLILLHHSRGYDVRYFLPAAVLAIGAVLTREFARRVCFASRIYNTIFVLDTSAALLQLLMLWVLATHHALTVISALYAIAGATVPYIVFGVIVAPRLSYSKRHILAVGAQHWPFSKWLILGTSVAAIPQQIFPWCLALFYGPGAAGMLASCNGLIQSANPFLIGFTNYFGPHVARVRRESGDIALHEALRKASLGLLAFFALFCCMIFIFGSSLLTLVFGHRFATAPNVHALWLLSLGVLVSQSTLPLGLVFLALDRPRINALASLAAVCVAATIGVAAVRLIGIDGVGLGVILAGFTESAVKIIFYSRTNGLKPYRQGALHVESSA